MSLLLELTLRGTLVILLATALNRIAAGRIATPGRRWWWLLIPVGLLLPVHLPVLPTPAPVARAAAGAIAEYPVVHYLTAQNTLPAPMHARIRNGMTLAATVWAAGVAGYLGLVALRTVQVQRRWARRRLSTDCDLLNLLEDCKHTAGVTAPIGLVIAPDVAAPAILGWLRPRILLPTELVTTLPREQLRAVLLHELAHFRHADVPVTWLFTVARAVHWFNPLVHLAARGWFRFREEAADEAAMRWMHDASGREYGATLLQTLRPGVGPVPYGALGIGESFNHLQQRLVMIRNASKKSPCLVLVSAGLLALSAIAVLRTSAAEPKTDAGAAHPAAVAAATSWLQGVDAGEFAQSWSQGAAAFQAKISQTEWETLVRQTRTPLGKLTQRTVASVLELSDMAQPGGTNRKGEFVVVQFDAAYENLKSAIESVTLEKEADGVWRMTGAFIQPGRTPDAGTRTDLEARPVSSAALDACVGKYDYSGGQRTMVLTVTRDGDRLFAQMTGQPTFEIFARSETEFFWKAVPAEISFVKDTSGRVTKAIHRQNGRSIDVARIE